MTTQPTTTTLATLRHPAAMTAPDVSMGFGSLASFELMQRAAKLLCSSTLVPTQYRAVIEKLDKYGNVKERKENPNALANAVVALNMAQRMGADPLMIMQNLYVIEGRPSWSSQFIVAAINGCGKFSPLRFTLRDLGGKEVEHRESFWENGQRQTRSVKVQVEDRECIAWALERETGDRLESPPVTMEMAVKEGWFTKSGSKWQTMPDVMLRYRAASFFGRLYAPELLMGLKTVEEAHEVIDVTPDAGDVLSVTTDRLRADTAPAEVVDVQTGEVLPKGAEETEQPEQKTEPQPEPPANPDGTTTKTAEPPKGNDNVAQNVKAFLREINAKKTADQVNQWRAKHQGRVARYCGGQESDWYLQVMDYAEVKYRDLLEAEKQEAKSAGGKKDASLF